MKRTIRKLLRIAFSLTYGLLFIVGGTFTTVTWLEARMDLVPHSLDPSAWLWDVVRITVLFALVLALHLFILGYVDGKSLGSRLLTQIRRSCSEKTMRNVYEPLYADFLYEYNEALDAGRRWQARSIRMRSFFSLLKTVGLFNIMKLGKEFAERWRAAS